MVWVHRHWKPDVCCQTQDFYADFYCLCAIKGHWTQLLFFFKLLSICFRKLKTSKGASCLPGFWNLINSSKQKVLSEGVKCAWIGQRTLTPLIYPNKHSFSLPPSASRGYRTNPSLLPCPEPLTQPSRLLSLHLQPEATQDTHSHTHVIKSLAGYGWGNSMSGKEVQKPVGTQNSTPWCWALRGLEENSVTGSDIFWILEQHKGASLIPDRSCRFYTQLLETRISKQASGELLKILRSSVLPANYSRHQHTVSTTGVHFSYMEKHQRKQKNDFSE